MHITSADYWTFEEITFENRVELGNSINEVAEYITFYNCRFRDSNVGAIRPWYAQHILIEDCYFVNVRSGNPGGDLNAVSIDTYADDITIRNCIFEDIGSDGIHIGALDNQIGQVIIENNEFFISGQRSPVGENGVDVKAAQGPVIIRGNTFHGFRKTVDGQDASGGLGEGVVVHWQYTDGPQAYNVTIDKNLFYDNAVHIWIANGDVITVTNNIFRDTYNQGMGLVIYDATGIDVLHNTFTRNAWHIRTGDDRPMQGRLVNNVFVGGDFNVSGEFGECHHNAWDTGPLPNILQGNGDITGNLGLNETLHPETHSPLLLAGINIGISDDYDGTPRGNPPTIGAFELATQEWYDYCPPDPPTQTPWSIQPTYTPLPVLPIQPTYTPDPTPLCRPTATLAPNPSPTLYPTQAPPPTHTPYPTSTPYPSQPPSTPPLSTDTPEPTDVPEPTETPKPTPTPGTASCDVEVYAGESIQNSVDNLSGGEVLCIHEGTYSEGLHNIPSGNGGNHPTTIMAYPGETAIINGAWEGYVIYVSSRSYITFDGLILDGGIADEKVLSLQANTDHIVVKNCELRNQADGSGIFTAGHYNEFINLEIHHNGHVSGEGHGIYMEGDYNLLENCNIHHNAGYGIHVYNGSSNYEADYNVVRNNIVHENGQGNYFNAAGIGLCSGQGNLAYNNIVYNETNGPGFIVSYGATNAMVFNNTSYANATHGIYIKDTAVSVAVTNNIFWQNASGPVWDRGPNTTMLNNMDIDPRFVNTTNRDFHLQANSTAINAGVTLREVPDDFDGVARPQGMAYDIGAYEFISE